MGKVFLGIVIGLVISFAIGFFVVKDMKEKSYEEGFSKGQKKGEEEGRLTGITQGKAEQKRYYDSVQVVVQQQLEAAKLEEQKKVVRPKPVNYDINYNMYGNSVGEKREKE